MMRKDKAFFHEIRHWSALCPVCSWKIVIHKKPEPSMKYVCINCDNEVSPHG